MDFGHLLKYSSLTLLEISLIGSHGFFCLLVCGRLLSSTIYYEAFSSHDANISLCIPKFCSKLELYLFLVQSLCLFCSLSKCVQLFIPYYSSILLLFFFRLLLLMVQFSLPCDRAGWDSVLYSFVLVFFKIFCCLNTLLIMPVIVTLLPNSLKMSIFLNKISHFLRGEKNLFVFSTFYPILYQYLILIISQIFQEVKEICFF
jgi:hypothetical protein